MNINKLEIELRNILDDKEFTLNPKYYYHQIIECIQELINDIGRLNDALGNVTYIKDYYSDVFNNRRETLNYILNCEDVEYVIERRLKELKSSVKLFIFRMYKNKDLYELLIEDFPNFEKVVYKITKLENQEKNHDDEIIDVIDYLEDWLDIISFEELDDDVIGELDEEFNDYYDYFLLNNGVKSND